MSLSSFLTPLTSRSKAAVDTPLSPSSKEYKALSFEQQVFRAINLVRKNPSVFVKLLDTYKNILEGKNKEDDEENNNNNASSDNSNEINEVEEALDFIKKQESLPPLRFSEALSKAAKEGIRSNSLEDTAVMQTRVERFGEWDDVLAENVHFGDQANITGTNIVVDWIIDAGVKNRGHRSNIFSRDFHVVGVAVGTHKVYKNVCVATFTGDFKEKEVKGVRFVDEVETSDGTVETYNDVPLKEVVADSEGKVLSEEAAEQVKKVESSPARRTFYESSSITPARLSFVSDDLLSKYEEMGIPVSAELKRKRLDIVSVDSKRNKTNGTTPTNRKTLRRYASAPVTPVKDEDEEEKGIFRRFLDVISPFR